MIEIRKRHPAFGLGAYEELAGSNPSVLAFVREYDAAGTIAAQRLEREYETPVEHDAADRMLCVNNLSRFPQPVELDLRRFMGVTPVECMGGVAFPADRGAAVPADPARARLLLVSAPAREGGT